MSFIMLRKIDDYKKFVGEGVIETIKESASQLEGKHITNINSTYSGGGVAEILNSLVVLMNTLGIDAGWRLLKGSHSFFDITKKFHNALQGQPIHLSDKKKEIYLVEVERNSLINHLEAHDLVIIHDPQPLAMIAYKKKNQPWLWRCHIDITQTYKPVWDFLLPYIQKYDGMIVSMEKYKKEGLNIPQMIVPPSIDPLTLKNKKMSDGEAEKILSRNGIDMDKPIITQVSRFDKWKNPLGVVKIFERVKKKVNAQLVLMGDMASDDPEGPILYNNIVEKSKKVPDIHLITKKDDGLVNALQRKSSVVLQCSIKEGFALSVTEALWKRAAVVATNVGGIPLQVIHKKTGILVENTIDAAHWCVELINNEALRKELGANGKEHVRNNFLVTRHLQDYLDIFNHYIET